MCVNTAIAIIAKMQYKNNNNLTQKTLGSRKESKLDIIYTNNTNCSLPYGCSLLGNTMYGILYNNVLKYNYKFEIVGLMARLCFHTTTEDVTPLQKMSP